ncbi:Hypothetical protein XFF4834R_plb00110 (plasmid) [Xanthomonas citri pv. fuscans]|nr:Hypothetical protein XFF4834R_plb00110 [Xanthomonas citri pv. fuscans]
MDSAEWSCGHGAAMVTTVQLARSRPVANAPAGALKLSWSQIQLIDRERLSPITAHPGKPGPGCRAAHRASRESAVSPLRLPSLSGELDKSPPLAAGLSRAEPIRVTLPDRPARVESEGSMLTTDAGDQAAPLSPSRGCKPEPPEFPSIDLTITQQAAWRRQDDRLGCAFGGVRV